VGWKAANAIDLGCLRLVLFVPLNWELAWWWNGQPESIEHGGKEISFMLDKILLGLLEGVLRLYFGLEEIRVVVAGIIVAVRLEQDCR